MHPKLDIHHKNIGWVGIYLDSQSVSNQVSGSIRTQPIMWIHESFANWDNIRHEQKDF